MVHKNMDVFIIRFTADMQPANSRFECLKCANSWYASKDSISSWTIESLNPTNPIGTTPGKVDKLKKWKKQW